MKKCYLFLILTVFFSYCNSQNDHYEIKGKLDNSDNEWIYLSEMTVKDIIPLDSVRIDKNGEFGLRGTTEYPTFVLLKTDDQNRIILIADNNDKISVSGDVNDLYSTYDIKGSDDSRLIREFSKRLDFFKSEKMALSQTYKDSINSPNQEEIRKDLEQKYKDIVEELRQYSRTFINKNNESLASLYALYQQLGPQEPILTPDKDLSYFEKVDSSLSSSYPTLPYVQELNKQLTLYKEKLKQQEIFEENLGIGAVAPDIALPSPEGDTILLSSLKGKYVLLDFWASWCRPCRTENPNLVKNYQKYNKKGFEIYQVSLDKSKDSWEKAIEGDGLDWYHVSDLKYWNSSVVPVFQVHGIPANYLLDKEGRIIAKNLRGEELGRKLNELFE